MIDEIMENIINLFIHCFETATGHQYDYETLFSPVGSAFFLNIIGGYSFFESMNSFLSFRL